MPESHVPALSSALASLMDYQSRGASFRSFFTSHCLYTRFRYYISYLILILIHYISNRLYTFFLSLSFVVVVVVVVVRRWLVG